MLSLVPDFESLLEDQKLDGYISNIVDQAADVQPKRKKEYIKPIVNKLKDSNSDNDNKEQTINKLKKELDQEKASVQALTEVNQSLSEKLKTETETEAGTGLYQ